MDLNLVAKGGICRSTTAAGVNEWGYGAGLYTADWFDGKSVPQAMKGPNHNLDSAEKVAAYMADMADPEGTTIFPSGTTTPPFRQYFLWHPRQIPESAVVTAQRLAKNYDDR